MVYEDLLEQYSNLSEEEKNVLLVYKTKLSNAINDLDNEKLINELYERYIKILDNPTNLFIKLSILKDIDFSSLDAFKISLESYHNKMNEVTNKLIINDEITVYRAFSVDEETNEISKDSIISTSLNIDTCLDFFIPYKNKKHYLYEIKINKNSPCAVCPYQITYNSKNNQMAVSTKKDQYEIMINKKNYDFEQVFEKTTNMKNGEELTIRTVYALSKEKDLKTKKEIA